MISLDLKEIRETVEGMMAGDDHRPAVAFTPEEFEAMLKLTIEFRTRHDHLCQQLDGNVITRGQFYDRSNAVSDDMMDQTMALLGPDRYASIFDSTETRIRWCTREQFVAMPA